MQRDAESHASDDKHKRELAEARNSAEQQVYQLEKLMDEHKEKLTDSDKAAVRAAIEKVNEAKKGDDSAALTRAVDDLKRAGQAMGEHLYANAAQSAPGAGEGPGGHAPHGEGSANGGGGPAGGKADDVIDVGVRRKEVVHANFDPSGRKVLGNRPGPSGSFSLPFRMTSPRFPPTAEGVGPMSLDNARAAYPVLVQIARDLSQAVRDRRTVSWISYDDFCTLCKDIGIKETPRTVAAKLLKPLQAVCLEHQRPDLSAIIIQKPRARSDFGNLLRPADSWWELYVTRGETTVGDVTFWFERFKAARDYEEWPEAPFF